MRRKIKDRFWDYTYYCDNNNKIIPMWLVCKLNCNAVMSRCILRMPKKRVLKLDLGPRMDKNLTNTTQTLIKESGTTAQKTNLHFPLPILQIHHIDCDKHCLNLACKIHESYDAQIRHGYNRYMPSIWQRHGFYTKEVKYCIWYDTSCLFWSIYVSMKHVHRKEFPASLLPTQILSILQ